MARKQIIPKSAFQSDGIYTDAGVLSAGNSVLGGVWAWCYVDGGTVRSSHSGILLVKGVAAPVEMEGWCEEEESGQPHIEINLMELYAAVKGLEAHQLRHPLNANIHLLSDSGNAIGRLTKGWAMKGVPDAIVKRVKKLSGEMTIQTTLLSGHPTVRGGHFESGVGPRGYPCSEHNVFCDKECDRLRNLFKDYYTDPRRMPVTSLD